MPSAPSPALDPPSGPRETTPSDDASAAGSASVGGASVGGASVGGASVGGASVGSASVTDEQIRAVIAPLYAVSTGMSRAIANKPLVNRLTVLQAVAHSGAIRPSDIASALNLHQSQVTRQVQALEQEALVEVAPDPSDRRSWLITLTAAGAAEIDRLNAIGMRRWARFLADFDPSEVDELARLLTKLHTSITEANATPGPRGRG
jgi:DNA-binding MarR family transcriptional regulator